MKQVPENKTEVAINVPTREEQLAALREKLTGHQAFGRVRGLLNGKGKDPLLRLVDMAGSPTSFCHRWDEFAADIRVVGNMVAQFRRDGWKEAEVELTTALSTPGHLIPGETFPLHETVPVTILILDPLRTFTMLRWIRVGHTRDLDIAISHGLSECNVPNLTRDLVVSFPRLLDPNNRRICTEETFYQALEQDVYFRFANVSALWDLESAGQAFSLRMNHNTCYRLNNTFGHRHGKMFGFMLLEEQNQALSRFSRQDQSRIGTWLCRVPKTSLPLVKYMGVGLHPEAAHAAIVQRYPAMASVGCAFNFGVQLFTQEHEAIGYLHNHNKIDDNQYVRNVNSASDPIAFLLST